MVQRILKPSSQSSYFLFGARGTGKTTLLHSIYSQSNSEYIDLLDPEEEANLALRPSLLETRVAALPSHIEWIIIDEIQRIPRLLDCVHRLIENTNKKFVLTGSSGRKLKREGTNLLAGRAFLFNLFPLTHRELGAGFDLHQTLIWGSLPRISALPDDQDKARFLKSYAYSYLREEIKAEQLVRNLDPFRHFLEIAAQTNGRIINYSTIARETGVDVKTVQNYYSILEDTLIGVLLSPFHRSIRKRQLTHPKFYFFDLGVKRALENSLLTGLIERTYAYGEAFEHFIILELIRLSQYAENDWRLSYLMTQQGAEIDLVIERPGRPLALVEIKSTDRIFEHDTATLARFVPDLQPCEAFLFSRDPHPQKIGNILCLPWEQGLRELGL